MGAVLNRSVAADGVIAYQDHLDKNKFHYLPARIDAVLGETLRDFSVTYYGINRQPYYVDLGNLDYQSAVGGILSGQAVPGITRKQLEAILKEITKKFQIKDPNLTPLLLRNVEVQPIFAQHIIDMGKGGSVVFPKTLQFGNQFGYSIGAPNSLFAELVARYQDGGNTSSPEFGINISGTPEFYGDPWEARIQCDLRQVWEYTRTKVGAGLNLGFFDLGVQVDDIAQSLVKDNIVKITYIEGSGGKEFGRQLLETTKQLFEAINKQVTSGEGLFRFEPNPKPQEPASGSDSWGASLLPFTAQVNMSFASNFFSQSIKFDQIISFTGKIDDIVVNSSMSLAAPCSTSSRKYFHDLQMGTDGCLDVEKRNGLQERIRKERAAKQEKIKLYFSYVEEGRWTPDKYAQMLTILNTVNLTESAEFTRSGAMTVRQLSRAEANARLAELERRLEASFEDVPAPRLKAS
ncbi:hypothetical protein F0U61_34485 [Archangium violaceum]|uniref:hypothetical protein n=1 Tax=Archangium violaceum TaxID=83451 RepID=UPI002B2E09F4|nr:hypothetical protein F0U61_34485 [Archangium violaceum]